jgi:hypothetical protein
LQAQLKWTAFPGVHALLLKVLKVWWSHQQILFKYKQKNHRSNNSIIGFCTGFNNFCQYFKGFVYVLACSWITLCVFHRALRPICT